MNAILSWLDHRTGYRRLIEVLLIEHIPGGAKWRYVWGSTLVFVFTLQLITGVLLMTAYSPGDSTAWASVYYIQYEMDFGWLIRGLHHFGSATMVVLLGLHMLQVVIAGAHLPPREINWWLGLVLLALVMGMSLTGYLLPWDQKGYWATQVATNIAANTPVIGQWLQKVIVGGPEYGHHTLTRFFALHVAILPPLIVVFIIAHMTVFRRHGVTVSRVTIPVDAQGEPVPQKEIGWFWPDQAFRDMLISMVIFGILLTLVIFGHAHPQTRDAEPDWWERTAHAGRDGAGANLDAPADPSQEYPARPEWYFLFLFQLLKYFPGEQEVIGTVVIPAAVGGLLFILPLLGHGRMRKFGHTFGVLVVIAILVAAAGLTWLAFEDDRKPPELTKDQVAALEGAAKERHSNAAEFHEKLRKASVSAERAVQLARHGIPADGPRSLLLRDPVTRGRELFEQKCMSCHSYQGVFDKGEFKAADLANVGSEKWISELLNDPANPRFFGRTKLKDMLKWVQDNKADPEGAKAEELALISKWLAGHPRGMPKEGDDKSDFAKGFAAFGNRCNDCHKYEGEGGQDKPGPDFTGYGSADWLRTMIMSPGHPLRYGKKNTMPAFRNTEGVAAELSRFEYQQITQLEPDKLNIQHLSDLDRELIIRWLLKDDRVVFGGDPVSGPPKKE